MARQIQPEVNTTNTLHSVHIQEVTKNTPDADIEAAITAIESTVRKLHDILSKRHHDRGWVERLLGEGKSEEEALRTVNEECRHY